jgi:hypothetical protein
MKMKQSGAEITDTILYPEVAFTGDTKSDFILDPRNADALRAKVLITEVLALDFSFLDYCPFSQACQKYLFQLYVISHI